MHIFSLFFFVLVLVFFASFFVCFCVLKKNIFTETKTFFIFVYKYITIL